MEHSHAEQLVTDPGALHSEPRSAPVGYQGAGEAQNATEPFDWGTDGTMRTEVAR